jgi:hypothetical protein
MIENATSYRDDSFPCSSLMWLTHTVFRVYDLSPSHGALVTHALMQ